MTDAPSLHRSTASPSPWIVRWSHLVPPEATVLDIACGSGRHLAWFAQRGHAVTGIDRDLAPAQKACAPGTLVCADIEAQPWPLMAGGQPQVFGALVVTNYLWRPLWQTMLQSVAPGGVFLYETFAAGNETVGRPARPEFLLQPGELLNVCKDLQVIAYENGFLDGPARFVQRIAAIRPGAPGYSKNWSERYTRLG
ncbi:MAG: SAM-dependent methyltransferase [Burkholderiales bacterium RIFCSPLOWO2_12_FULL_61_40]|nr:MAG: SAM-dependent methyltransferase [Burkholderiales bacterium RIFCSPLOWO2_12_FULL_61_40]